MALRRFLELPLSGPAKSSQSPMTQAFILFWQSLLHNSGLILSIKHTTNN